MEPLLGVTVQFFPPKWTVVMTVAAVLALGWELGRCCGPCGAGGRPARRSFCRWARWRLARWWRQRRRSLPPPETGTGAYIPGVQNG